MSDSEDLASDDWLDISTTFNMVPDAKYRFQNTSSGTSTMTIVFNNTKPPLTDTGLLYDTREPLIYETIIYDGTQKVWGRVLYGTGRIAVVRVEV